MACLLVVLIVSLGWKKILMMAFYLVYDDDEYTQVYAQIKEAFRAVTKKMISFNHIHFMMILDLQMLVSLLLRTMYTFSVKDISKIYQLLNQLK